MSTLPVPRLPIGDYRLVFRPGSPLPRGYLGSAWRGAFGHALKQAVCVTRDPECSHCSLYRNCAYPYLFETPVPPDSLKMRRYTAAPHPFVLGLPFPELDRAVPGGEVAVELRLFGRANSLLPYTVHAFRQAAQRGLGRRRATLDLLRVEQRLAEDELRVVYQPGGSLAADPPLVPQTPQPGDRMRVELLSPLRLIHNQGLCDAREFSFGAFFSPLLRRLAMLTYFHTEEPFEPDFRALTASANQVALSGTDLRWSDWTRYSSRQDTTMKMGGLLGTFQLPADPVSSFWPLLWLGQWTHVGKGTSMGLGRYRVVFE